MNPRRRAAALAGALATAAALFAAPAHAVLPPADGTYAFTMAGSPSTIWSMQTLCSQPSGTRIQSDYTDTDIQTMGCDLLVAAKTPTAGGRDNRLASFDQRFKLTNGLWTAQYTASEGAVCPGGGYAPTTEIYAFTENGLTGTHKRITAEGCGLPAGIETTPFTLAFLAPLDPPVANRFPMQCNYLVGRPSICS
ncbi:MAG: hypothetical protein U0R77_06165 [Mycolicibacterium insubricum]|nr:hypothetical protein [Mycobacterium sp.]